MQQRGMTRYRETRGCPAFISPVLFFPKAAISYSRVIYRGKGRSSDLLHFFAAFPSAGWRTVAQVAKKLIRSLQHRVMSGIYTRFPFHHHASVRKPLRDKSREFFGKRNLETNCVVFTCYLNFATMLERH